MRILYAVTGAEIGGAVRHVMSLIRSNVKDGHVVGLVAAPEPFLISEARNIGVHVFANRFFVREVQFHNDIRALWPVLRAISKFKPDIVSAHSTKAGYAARLVCAIARKPIVFTAHGWAFADGRRQRQRFFLRLAERVAAACTDRIICVSRNDLSLAEKFRVTAHEKLALIRNGVDPAPYCSADGASVRTELGLGKALVVTMVGRLAPPKDPLTLLRAAQILRGEFRILIVGDGELRDKVEEFIHDYQLESRVILAGQRLDIPEILAASDVFVLSSHWEGLPLAVIEAEMAALPVVASSVGGTRELVQESVSGFTVPADNPQALAERIQELLNDNSLRQRLGAAAREKALRDFALDRMLRETQLIYEDVLKSRLGHGRGHRTDRECCPCSESRDLSRARDGRNRI